MNHVIKNYENGILISPESKGMWNMITVGNKKGKSKYRVLLDMVYVQSLVPISFLGIWIYLIIILMF